MKAVPEMVTIPAGSVVLGVPSCPRDYSLKHHWQGPRETMIPALQIGKLPVTRAEYKAFLDATGHELPADWDDPVLGDPRMPACGVSWEDAVAYCTWLSSASGMLFRLPSADEWEKAARGGLVGKRYPWGDDDPEGRCCFGKPAE